MDRRLSVIIPALDEADQVAAAIDSAWASGATQVIVVDGGSRDATAAIAQSSGALVIDSPPSRGVQLHAGALASDGETLLFLHADNRLPIPPNRRVIDQIAAAGVPSWGALRQRIDDPRFVYRVVAAGNAVRVRLFGRAFGDQALFVRRENYFAVGGFPAVPLMEDVMLSAALRRQSRPVLIDGPVAVDARRWHRRGLVRQTWLNWRIQTAFALGVSPERLRQWYR